MLTILATLYLYIAYAYTTPQHSFCFDVPFVKYTCPDPKKTSVACFGRKIPIGKGASSTDIWTTPTLLVLPGDRLRCTVYCRTELNGDVSEENCHSRLFKFTASRGVIRDFEKADTSSFHFYYEADRDVKSLKSKETTANIKVFYRKKIGSDEVLSQGNIDILYPPLVGTQSTLDCPYNFVRFRGKMDCKIEPKAQEGRIIPASPFEFDVKLTDDSNVERGDFAPNSFLAISADAAEKDTIVFQYEAGNKEGCNFIRASIGSGIPNYAEVGNQIRNSPYKICTVGGNEVSLRGRVWYSLLLVLLAAVHTARILM